VGSSASSGPSVPRIEALLWDIGGVLLSNAWDHADRAAAAARFGLDLPGLNARHDLRAEALETGRLSWARYLDEVVFTEPRPFDRAEFQAFVESRSVAYPVALRLARRLRSSGRFTMAVLNNEVSELNDLRIRRFGLSEIFHVFFSSSTTGRRKPDPAAYRFALSLLHLAPPECLFLDDRAENIEAAARLGLGVLQVRDPDRLPEDLMAVGISP